jgi:CAAX protease family protein
VTPFWLDHALALLLAVFFPIRAATFGYRRLAIASPERVTAVRHALYSQAIALQWSLAALVMALWVWGGRDWAALGLIPRSVPGLVLGLASAGAVAVALWVVRARARARPEMLERYLEKLTHIERMLPRTPGERNAFYAVSITAGICEELLYRGFALWYLSFAMGIVPAVLVSSLVFGIGHAYQGAKGIVTTGLVGLFMAMVYLATRSLWAPMALHALTDLHAGAITYAALKHRAEVARRAPASSEGTAAPEV